MGWRCPQHVISEHRLLSQSLCKLEPQPVWKPCSDIHTPDFEPAESIHCRFNKSGLYLGRRSDIPTREVLGLWSRLKSSFKFSTAFRKSSQHPVVFWLGKLLPP